MLWKKTEKYVKNFFNVVLYILLLTTKEITYGCTQEG